MSRGYISRSYHSLFLTLRVNKRATFSSVLLACNRCPLRRHEHVTVTLSAQHNDNGLCDLSCQFLVHRSGTNQWQAISQFPPDPALG
jgi:hypothetical protein